MQDKITDDAAWQLELPSDSDAKQTYPLATLSSLKALYGKRSAKSGHTEKFYWCLLLEHVSIKGVAEAILERLRLDSEAELLDIGQQARHLLIKHFQQFGLSKLVAMKIPDKEREQASSHLGMLSELAFEVSEEFVQAVALYALAHDEIISKQDYNSRYQVMYIRYQLARSLLLIDEYNKNHIQRCVAFCRATLKLLQPLWKLLDREGLRKDAFYALEFELQQWLGGRLKELGNYKEAGEAFSKASINARRNIDDRVFCTTEFALTLEKQGQEQSALDILSLCKDDIPNVKDEEIKLFWEYAYINLRKRFGVDLNIISPINSTNINDVNWQALMDAIMQGKTIKIEQLEAIIEQHYEMLNDMPQEEIVYRYQLFIQLALLLFELGKWKQANESLQQAELLEDHIEDESLKLERKIILARSKAETGNISEAVALFASLLPQAKHILDLEQLLQFMGYYLETLGKYDAFRDVEMLYKLVDQVIVILERLFRQQLGKGGRRYVRLIHQRPLETAILVLATMAHKVDQKTDVAQAILKNVWSFLNVIRNPELHWHTAAPMAGELANRLQELENDFHKVLRHELVMEQPQSDDPSWLESLDKVMTFEMTAMKDMKLPGYHNVELPTDGIAVAFFIIQQLLKKPALLVITHYEGKFDSHIISYEDTTLKHRLETFRNQYFALYQTSYKVRETRHRPILLDTELDKEAPKITELLPESLKRLLKRKPNAYPWYLFPDGLFYSLPIEMLSDSDGDAHYFGQNRAVQLCLRSSIPSSIHKTIDFTKGWLGLGGVAYVDGIRAIPNSLNEIEKIQSFLQHNGFNANILKDTKANAAVLEANLENMNPEVLHFAVHGVKDDKYPDACALILAKCSGRAEEDLLPFRRILHLPLHNIELVVLSACHSLIGRTDPSSGIEGLAWAFLQAGVTQVIATRYQVSDDKYTVNFMQTLYHYLMTLPVAEALGRARDDALSKGMDPRQVGAWSLWV